MIEYQAFFVLRGETIEADAKERAAGAVAKNAGAPPTLDMNPPMMGKTR